MTGLEISRHVCVICGETFTAVRSIKANHGKTGKNSPPRYCDAHRRHNSRWGKGYPGKKKT